MSGVIITVIIISDSENWKIDSEDDKSDNSVRIIALRGIIMTMKIVMMKRVLVKNESN